MKTLKLFLFGAALFMAVAAQAQVSVNVNIGAPPMWGPVGYSEAQYYYLPDVEAYYDVPSSMFIYQSGGVWVHRTYLPTRYRNYDLYNGYKVVMTDYHGNTPYTHFREHRHNYAKGYRGPAQHNIGARPSKGNSGSNNKIDRHAYKELSHGKYNYSKSNNGNQGKDNNGKSNKGNHDNGNGHGKKK